MCDGVPVNIYLQGLSLLIGLVSVLIPIAITIAGFVASRQFSNRLDSIAIDIDEALDRISELEAQVLANLPKDAP